MISSVHLYMITNKGIRRIREEEQRHREEILDMLAKSDPYTLPRDLVAGSPAESRPEHRQELG